MILPIITPSLNQKLRVKQNNNLMKKISNNSGYKISSKENSSNKKDNTQWKMNIESGVLDSVKVHLNLHEIFELNN